MAKYSLNVQILVSTIQYLILRGLHVPAQLDPNVCELKKKFYNYKATHFYIKLFLENWALSRIQYSFYETYDKTGSTFRQQSYHLRKSTHSWALAAQQWWDLSSSPRSCTDRKTPGSPFPGSTRFVGSSFPCPPATPRYRTPISGSSSLPLWSRISWSCPLDPGACRREDRRCCCSTPAAIRISLNRNRFVAIHLTDTWGASKAPLFSCLQSITWRQEPIKLKSVEDTWREIAHLCCCLW